MLRTPKILKYPTQRLFFIRMNEKTHPLHGQFLELDVTDLLHSYFSEISYKVDVRTHRFFDRDVHLGFLYFLYMCVWGLSPLRYIKQTMHQDCTALGQRQHIICLSKAHHLLLEVKYLLLFIILLTLLINLDHDNLYFLRCDGDRPLWHLVRSNRHLDVGGYLWFLLGFNGRRVLRCRFMTTRGLRFDARYIYRKENVATTYHRPKMLLGMDWHQIFDAMWTGSSQSVPKICLLEVNVDTHVKWTVSNIPMAK